VGRITKAHGLKGEVVVALSTTEASRVDVGATLWAGDRELRVVSSRPHQDRWIVQFEGVAGREAADDLRGTILSAPPIGSDEADDPDALWVHELIGAEVVDVAGRSRGRVDAVQANPASDLLVLDSGVLVPLTFVVRWVERPRVLEIDPPVGLFDD
jgi:16S rRNA processing protein RimM